MATIAQTRTNLATNPSFEATSGTVNVRTNLATNPSFEAASGTVNVRTNLCTNPSFETNTSNWAANSGAPTLSLDTSQHYAGTQSLKAVGTNTSGDVAVSYGSVSLAASTTYTVSWWVYSADARSQCWVDVAYGVTYSSPSTAIAANTWTRLSATFTTNSTGGSAVLYFHHGGGPTTAGAALWIDAVLIEQSSVLGSYFDGSTAAAGDFTYAWSSTANASTSYQQAPGVASMSTGWKATAYQSTQWSSSRGHSLRITPTDGSDTDSFSDVQGVNLAVGRTYTISAVFRQAAPQTGPQGYRARSILVYDGTDHLAQATNVAGSQRVSVTFTVASAGVSVFRLYNGTTAGGGDVWWDDLLIEQSSAALAYFDGTTPATIRTNLAVDPNATALTNWGLMGSGGQSISVDSTLAHSGTTSIKNTCTSAGVIGLACNVTNPGFTTGDTVVWSVWVYPSATTSIQPYWERINNTYEGGGSPAVTCPAGTWTQLTGSVTFTSGQANAGDAFHFGILASSAVAVGVTINADQIIVERAATVGPYFDGGTSAGGGYRYQWAGAANGSVSYMVDADFTWAWSGAADASTSYQQAPGAAGMQAYWNADHWGVYQSKANPLYRAATYRALALNPSSFLYGPSYTIPVAPGQVWTTSAYVNPSYVNGAAGTRGFRFVCHFDGGGADVTGAYSNAQPGVWTRFSSTFTVPAGATQMNVYLDCEIASVVGDVYDFDGLLIEQSSSLGTYFDGSLAAWNPAGYSPPATWSNRWSGQQDASTSIATLSVPLQDYQVQLPDNTILGAGTAIGYLEVTGLRGTAPTRSTDTDRGGMDGQTPGMSYLTARTVGVKWLIASPSVGLEKALQYLTRNWQNTIDPTTVVMTARDYLMQQALGTSKPVSMLQFQLPGRSVPSIAFGKPGKLPPPVDSRYQFGWSEIDSEWIVLDGKIYDATVNVASTGLPSSFGGAAFPWSFPVNFGPSTGGTLQVANGGMYPARPVVLVQGPVSNPTISNPNTGQYVKVKLSLQAGDQLIIDFDSRVVRLNGVNRNNQLDTGSSFFSIPPGGTSLSFSSTDGGSVSGTVSVYTLNTYSTF